MSDDRMSQDQAIWELVAGNQRQETNKRLASIEKHLAAQQARIVAQCPFCDGDLTKVNIEICKTCGKELAWFSGIVYKPGESEKQKAMELAGERDFWNKKIKEKLHELVPIKVAANNLKDRTFATFFCLWFISFFLTVVGFGRMDTDPGSLTLFLVVFGVLCFLLPFPIRLLMYYKATGDKPKGWNKNVDVDIAYFQSQLR